MTNQLCTKKFKILIKCGFVATLALFVSTSSLYGQKFNREDVKFQNEDIQLSGTLFLPDVLVKTPAVVILHGSGPDEGLGYKIYAEEFSKAGIATLVFDKRGSGKSGGDWQKRTFENMANDALAAVKYLQSRSEIDSQKVGVWGISQGGWTVAYAAARSKDIAFVVSIAGNSLTPTQQEMYHKDEIFKALGYSEKAQDTALKFWKLAFDWLVLVDEDKFPLPNGVMNSERSAASIGLKYDPLPDWEKIKQPVLLIHGDKDKLSPHQEAIVRISESLKKGGNENVTIRVFQNASHTITTNKTGLEFDWEDNFAPDYFKFTTDWIKAKTNGESLNYMNPPLANFNISPEFQANGRYGKLPWFGQTYLQFILMLFFPVFYVGCVLFWLSKIIRKNKKMFAKLTFGVLSLLNLFLIVGFFAFIMQSIFPLGVDLKKSYTIPLWQKLLPLLGDLCLILVLIFLIQIGINKHKISFPYYLVALANVVFVIWLYYWNFLGLWF